jgi:hypothetical protein
VDKRSASTIGLAADTLLAAATQIWNCCRRPGLQARRSCFVLGSDLQTVSLSSLTPEGESMAATADCLSCPPPPDPHRVDQRILLSGVGWSVWQDGRLRCYALGGDGYRVAARSRFLPTLDPRLIQDCMSAPSQTEALALLRANRTA